MIVWSAFCVTYNDVFIKLETVGGNLFVNMAIISLFEMSASFISGIISMKFDIFKTMKNLMTIEIILGALFLLAPIHVKQDMPLNQAVLLLIVLIFTKFFSDVINNLINLYGPKVFTDDFMGIFFTMSRLFSRIFLFCLPTINYYFELAGVHPFIFLSMLWLLCKVMTHQTAEIQEEVNKNLSIINMHLKKKIFLNYYFFVNRKELLIIFRVLRMFLMNSKLIWSLESVLYTILKIFMTSMTFWIMLQHRTIEELVRSENQDFQLEGYRKHHLQMRN